MTIGVYVIRCLSAGKSYIGCSKNVEVRIKDHKLDLRRGAHINPYLQRSWNLYGEESFSFDILLETDNMFEEEKRLIALHDTFKNGYNMTPGGEGVGADSPEVCAKRVKTFKENYNDETKRKKSVAAKKQLNQLTPEERVAFAKKGSDAAKEALANLTEKDKAIRSEKLASYSNRRWAKMDKSQRSEANRAIHMNRTEEERRLSALKSWETRRNNLEKQNGG